jgi:hypothetical protein
MQSLVSISGIASVALYAIPLAAHHGSSMYDLESTITVRGFVSNIRWANPYVEISVQGEDEGGSLVVWLLESIPPFQFDNDGLSVNDFGLGREVEFEAYPARNSGRISAWARSISIEGGPLRRLPEQGTFFGVTQE